MTGYCEALQQDCLHAESVDDCDHCMEFVTTCDICHVPGHTDSAGWFGTVDANGSATVYCADCWCIAQEEPK